MRIPNLFQAAEILDPRQVHCLFAAGGASNLVDRIAYGSVIDFMNLGIGSLRTGIFNVADMAIMLGAGILALEGWRSRTIRLGPEM